MGSPARGSALAVDALVEGSVERVAVERLCSLDAAEELEAELLDAADVHECSLHEIVQALEASVHAKANAELLEPPGRQLAAKGQHDLIGAQVLHHRTHALLVHGIALIVAAVAVHHPGGERSVNLLSVTAEWGEPSAEERGREAFRRNAEIVSEHESAKGLAQHRPLAVLAQQLLPDQLGIADNRVCTKEAQMAGNGVLVTLELLQCLLVDRCAQAGAALVQQQQAVLLQRALHPARCAGGPRRGNAWAALEVEQIRHLAVVDVARAHDLAHEDADAAAGGLAVVQRHVEAKV
mmetsp:Transcript_8490/g.35449  ORF Transcript_8490/g.35449 Transcript_8490/m.35449 type:complete len:294 (+) Transcript_8490:504-1385(+)